MFDTRRARAIATEALTGLHGCDASMVAEIAGLLRDACDLVEGFRSGAIQFGCGEVRFLRDVADQMERGDYSPLMDTVERMRRIINGLAAMVDRRDEALADPSFEGWVRGNFGETRSLGFDYPEVADAQVFSLADMRAAYAAGRAGQ